MDDRTHSTCETLSAPLQGFLQEFGVHLGQLKVGHGDLELGLEIGLQGPERQVLPRLRIGSRRS